MARPYDSAREHLEEMLALVGKLFERQINGHWELGLLPRIQDEFSGTFVSGDEVSAIMGGGVRVAASEDGQAKLDALDREIDERAAAIEDRLAASREAGRQIPLDRLGRAREEGKTQGGEGGGREV